MKPTVKHDKLGLFGGSIPCTFTLRR